MLTRKVMNKNQYMFIASKKRITMYSFTMSCSYFLTIYFCFVLWMLWSTFMPKINLGSVVRILRCVYIDLVPDKLSNVIARGCLKLNYICVCVYIYIYAHLLIHVSCLFQWLLFCFTIFLYIVGYFLVTSA